MREQRNKLNISSDEKYENCIRKQNEKLMRECGFEILQIEKVEC